MEIVNLEKYEAVCKERDYYVGIMKTLVDKNAKYVVDYGSMQALLHEVAIYVAQIFKVLSEHRIMDIRMLDVPNPDKEMHDYIRTPQK